MSHSPNAPVDNLLRIIVEQGSDELLLGVNRTPEMRKGGQSEKLQLPTTSDESLRRLLGPLLRAETEAAMLQTGGATLDYACSQGLFRAQFTVRQGGYDVQFKRLARPQRGPRGELERTLQSAIDFRPLPDVPTPLEIPPATHKSEGEQDAPLARVLTYLFVARSDHAQVRAGRLFIACEPSGWQRWGEGMDAMEILSSVLTASEMERIQAGAGVSWTGEASGHRVRIIAVPTRRDAIVDIRVIRYAPRTLDELGAALSLLSSYPLTEGLVLISGPPRSGRSTTLAALAGQIARQKGRVFLCVEDGNELPIPWEETESLAHEDVRYDPDPAWANHAASMADVVLLGSVNTLPRCLTALSLASMGRLVLGTTHLPSVAESIVHLSQLGSARQAAQIRTDLARTLTLAVAQRLVSRADGGGVALAAEILWVADRTRDVLGGSEGPTTETLAGSAEVFQTLEMSLVSLVQAGAITAAAAAAVANDPRRLAALGSSSRGRRKSLVPRS